MCAESKVNESLPPYESCRLITFKGDVLPDEEMVLDLEPEIDNFFTKAKVYADKNVSNDELDYLYASFQEASEFVAKMQGKKPQLNPLYDELEIFYRPVCIYAGDEEITYVGGYKTSHGYIVVSPPYLNCDYKDPSSVEPTSILAHELAHTYFAPRFHADPSFILEEGLATYTQRLLETQYGGYYNLAAEYPRLELTQEFPEDPHKPMMEIEAFAGVDADVMGQDGINHLLHVEEIFDHSDEGKKDSFSVTFDGQSLGLLKAGWCNDVSGDLLVCASADGEDHKLLTFPSYAEIERVAIINDFGEPVTPTGIDYQRTNYLYGEDGFGKRRGFERMTGLMNHLTYEFDQTAELLSLTSYQAAFMLHTMLEKLYWEQHSQTDPEFHPDDYFRKLGELHRNYVDYVFTNYRSATPSEGCETGETNVYHGLCKTLELPFEECLGIFSSFGLDTEFDTCAIEGQSFGVGFICAYDEGEGEDTPVDSVDEDNGNSGCSMSLY